MPVGAKPGEYMRSVSRRSWQKLFVRYTEVTTSLNFNGFDEPVFDFKSEPPVLYPNSVLVINLAEDRLNEIELSIFLPSQ